MTNTALVGGPLAVPGANIVPGFIPFTPSPTPGPTITITGPLAGRIDLIGNTYDLGLAYVDPASGNALMYGYVLVPGSTFSQTTNLQDEDHLVQVASPLSSDRYGRFPKVSQSDWSGGERQLLFVTPNQYYASQQCDASKPGHLRCFGTYQTVTLAQNAAVGAGRTLQSDGSNIYILTTTAGTIITVNYPALTTGSISAGSAAFVDIARGGDYLYAASNTPAMWQVKTATATQITNDQVIANTAESGVMAFFNGQLYYWASGNLLKSTQPPFPGAGAGTLVYTLPGMYLNVGGLSDSGSGLVFATKGNAFSMSEVFTFDGAIATQVGKLLAGQVCDMCEANGITYVLCAAPQANGTFLPVLYAITGNTLSLFDDFRNVDAPFQPQAGISHGARLDSDGQYLYLFFPGIRAKQYNLQTQSVYDIGAPTAIPSGVDPGEHRGCALLNGGFAEVDATAPTTLYVASPNATAPNSNGVLTTSFFDFGTPTTDKAFKFVEFQMNSLLDPSALLVSYRLDNLSAQWNSVPVAISPSGNTLIAYFPARALGHSLQLQITLVASRAPDVAAFAVYATLARVWKFTVACREGQTARTPVNQPDPQEATPQALQANLENARAVAGGLVTLWIPDPTIMPAPGEPPGVSQVNAQIQDLERTVSAEAGAGVRRGDDGVLRADADYTLTLTEVL